MICEISQIKMIFIYLFWGEVKEKQAIGVCFDKPNILILTPIIELHH